jgi:cytochrome P450
MRMNPGPGASPAANLLAMRRDPIAFFTKLARDHGDFVRFDVGGGPLCLVNHPDLIREVLLTHDSEFTRWYAVDIRQVLGDGLFVSEGDFYVRQRRLAQPAFHRRRIAGYAAAMVREATALGERWREGETRDIAADMNALAMKIVAGTLFGSDVNEDAEEVRAALSDVLRFFERSTIPAADRPEFDAARARLDATIYRMIQARRATGAEDRDDLLSMFLAARDADDGTGMTDPQVRDEVMNIFLAGHESTANALTWTWYLLSQNPEAECRLHAELDAVLGSRVPELSDAANLPWTEMVFAEALRLYPPLWSIARRAIGPVEISGRLLAPGTVVILSQFVTQRDARFFPEPDRFDPERFTPEAKMARPKFCYFPFSAGSRQCIGEPFAWLEGVLCIATIAQGWRLALAPGHRVEVQPALTLRAKHGMVMRLHRREPCPAPSLPTS